MLLKYLLLLLIFLLLTFSIASRGSYLLCFSHSIYRIHSRKSVNINSLSLVFLKIAIKIRKTSQLLVLWNKDFHIPWEKQPTLALLDQSRVQGPEMWPLPGESSEEDSLETHSRDWKPRPCHRMLPVPHHWHIAIQCHVLGPQRACSDKGLTNGQEGERFANVLLSIRLRMYF